MRLAASRINNGEKGRFSFSRQDDCDQTSPSWVRAQGIDYMMGVWKDGGEGARRHGGTVNRGFMEGPVWAVALHHQVLVVHTMALPEVTPMQDMGCQA